MKKLPTRLSRYRRNWHARAVSRAAAWCNSRRATAAYACALWSLPDDETLFVVAHELGHYVRRDPWLSIVLGTLFTAATIGLANRALRKSGRTLDTLGDGTPFAFYASLFSTVSAPFMAAISRAVERRADVFAVDATHDPHSGAGAFKRLREQNLAEDEQPKWAELLFSTHP